MLKVIHQSWQAVAQREATAMQDRVSLDFSGIFSEGTYAGTAFAGRIDYDPTTAPSEGHISFAMYEAWSVPVVTMAVGGQVMSAHGAAVYDSVFDGTANHYDFVTMYGTGPHEGVADAAFFELYFSDEDGAALDGTHMPGAGQLSAMPVKQMSLGTNAPGNVLSVGSFTLTTAG